MLARLPLVVTLALAIVLVAAPGHAGLAAHVYALVLAALGLGYLLTAMRDALPPRRPSAFDAALRTRPGPVQRIPELERMEREVALGLATAFDLHYRLRPRLRGIAAELLASRRGIELDGEPRRRAARARRRRLGDRPRRSRAAARAVRRRPRHRVAPTGGLCAGGALMELAQVQEHAARILDEVERAVVGKRDALELVLMGLLADGHVLLEDYPGLAKTLAARSFAQVTSIGFNRIQFTPDLMPADVTGSSIWNQRDADFLFRPGPIFTNLLLADEINRAPPKTQAALLEAMQERQVTIEGVTHPLARPFLVLATQNPIEYEGTYPLPEAQLDRFLLRVGFGYPSKSDEWEVLSRRLERREDEVELEPVIDGPTLLELQAAIEHVHVGPAVGAYIVELVSATRTSNSTAVGASPRGSLAVLKLARCKAALSGRDFVTPDDVKAVAVPALAHRLMLRPELWVQQVAGDDIVRELLESVPTPAAEETAPAAE